MTKFRLRSLLLAFVVLAVSTHSLQAQRAIGIRWNVPDDQTAAIAELNEFHQLGISIIEVRSELSPEVWNHIDSLQFEVYGNLGVRFPTASTFGDPDSTLINKIRERASEYLSQPSVTAITLFEYGAIRQSSFVKTVVPLANQIKQNGSTTLYHVTNDTAFQSVPSVDSTVLDVNITLQNLSSSSVSTDTSLAGYIFSPSDELNGFIRPFERFLQKTSQQPKAPIFLQQDWLLASLQKYPDFSTTLLSIATDKDAVLPLPNETIPESEPSTVPVILLLILWVSIGLHFNSSPLYRKSLFRYFTSHKFFIDDIFQRQIRSSFPAFIIILQHAVIFAASVFVTFLSLFSTLGQKAFFHHFPSAGIVGNNQFSLLVWTFLVVVIITMLSIIWLYLTHKKINSFTQIATIYAWPLQANLLFGTLAIILFAAGSSPTLITIFTAIGVLIFLMCFIASSFDTMRLANSAIMHHLKTSIPYIIILGGLLGWLLTNPTWIEPIRLALQLS